MRPRIRLRRLNGVPKEAVSIELTTKQRAYLRSLANTMPVVLHIGKEGIGDTLCKQAWDALEAREIIKCQVLKNAPMDVREACDELCARVHAEPVQCIGNRFIIYRAARKDPGIDLERLCRIERKA